MNADLKRKAMVKAVNRCHVEAMRIGEELRAIFAPLVGTKVLKVDGRLVAKVKDLLPTWTDHDRNLMVTQNSSTYSLSWSVKITELVENGNSTTSVNYGVSVYIGNLEGTTLLDVQFADPTYRTDYTEQELLEKRAAYKLAHEALDDARSACFPFDVEYDR